jgi:phage terminase large subunit-like protein
VELDFSLHDAQLEIYNHPAKYKVVAAGRRFGKSYYAMTECIIEGLKSSNRYGFDLKDKDVWYIAPTFQQARDIIWRLMKDKARPVTAKVHENTSTITLINGRDIKLKGSDRPDTLRGSGLGYVVLDEYAFMKPDVWDEILYPTLADVNGDALFIGTPAGKNHFYDVFLQGQSKQFQDQGWMSWQFNTTLNPILDKTVVSRAKDLLSDFAYKQEFEASFASIGSGLLKEDMLVEQEEEPLDGYYYIAMDPAGFADSRALTKQSKNLDDAAIAIVKIHKNGWWIKDIQSGRWGVRETALKIIRAAQSVNAQMVGIEKGSLLQALMPYLEDSMRRLQKFIRIEPVSHGNKKKTERIVWALQGRLEHGRIQMKPGSWNNKFRQQLADFPNPLVHDDMLDALAYIDQVGVTDYNNFSFDEFSSYEVLDPDAGY